MSMFAYAIAFLPAAAALTVAAFVIADERESAALNDLRSLQSERVDAAYDGDALESSAA